MRRWVSNDNSISEVKDEIERDINIASQANAETAALGIRWNRETGTISYEVNPPLDDKITKRGVLSEIARLYDPKGLLGPVLTAAKLIMQRLWRAKVHWDEAIPPEIDTDWRSIQKQLCVINGITFQRKVLIENA